MVMMWAWSVSRSISALHSRGLGITCDHSENGRFNAENIVMRRCRC